MSTLDFLKGSSVEDIKDEYKKSHVNNDTNVTSTSTRSKRGFENHTTIEYLNPKRVDHYYHNRFHIKGFVITLVSGFVAILVCVSFIRVMNGKGPPSFDSFLNFIDVFDSANIGLSWSIPNITGDSVLIKLLGVLVNPLLSIINFVLWIVNNCRAVLKIIIEFILWILGMRY